MLGGGITHRSPHERQKSRPSLPRGGPIVQLQRISFANGCRGRVDSTFQKCQCMSMASLQRREVSREERAKAEKRDEVVSACFYFSKLRRSRNACMFWLNLDASPCRTPLRLAKLVISGWSCAACYPISALRGGKNP